MVLSMSTALSIGLSLLGCIPPLRHSAFVLAAFCPVQGTYHEPCRSFVGLTLDYPAPIGGDVLSLRMASRAW